MIARVVLMAVCVAFYASTVFAQGTSDPPAATTTVGTTTTSTGSTTTSTAGSTTTSAPASSSASQGLSERYRDGMIIWETDENASVPFLLKFNINSQIRYLNTLDSDPTYTDHLGVTREVHTRNDITVNRAMFILGGYVFDKRAIYSFTVWTSAGASSIVVAANIGWQFNKRLTLVGGYTGVPGSRSLVDTFPFFASTDRTSSDNFFRPGFTQGMWAKGEALNKVYYLAFLGNGLNTLSISANKIDTHLLTAGSVWWEPTGDYGPPGKSRNYYDDYFASKKVRTRFGTSFTRSREDRFSNLDQSSPENTSMYNSDGVLTFSTGAFAPGVTVDEALYKLWAVDAGMKWNGLAINSQFFMRWIGDFKADGPMPLTSTFDRGGEISVGYFLKPKKVMAYGRASWIQGEFRDNKEYGFGFKFHYLPTERLWMNTELFHIDRAAYSGAFSPYTAGMNGWVPMVQLVLAF